MKKLVAIPALICTALAFAGVIAFAGCKQGEGERCQVNEDCEEGLVCNQATEQCALPGGGGIDATVPDGPTVDAAPDAPPDAS